MSEDIEVEVTDEVNPVDAVRQMMDKMATGDVTGANDAFNSIMTQRVGDALADRKQEMASNIFNAPEAVSSDDPEMAKMGLVVDAEEDSVEEPTDGEDV